MSITPSDDTLLVALDFEGKCLPYISVATGKR